MGRGEEPAGLHGAAQPIPCTLSACAFVPCLALDQSLCSLLVFGKHKRGGAGRPRARPKIFEFFFVKFPDAKLSNFKHGLVEIQNMIMQVEKKFMQGKI